MVKRAKHRKMREREAFRKSSAVAKGGELRPRDDADFGRRLADDITRG